MPKRAIVIVLVINCINVRVCIKILLILATYSSIGQAQVPNAQLDSLKHNLIAAKSDTLRVNLHLALGDYYSKTQSDTALSHYILALEHLDRVPPKKREGRYSVLKANALRSMGTLFRSQGRYGEAIEAFERAIVEDKSTGNSVGLSLTYNRLGNVYANQGEYDRAIEYYLLALRIHEGLDDLIKVSDCYSNIGVMYQNKKLYPEALDHFTRSLEIFESSFTATDSAQIISYKTGLSFRYNNIGVVYWYMDDYDRAIEYYYKSLALKEEVGDKGAAAQTLNNIAIVYCNRGNFALGIEYFQKSLDVKQELGDRRGMAMVNGNISNLYVMLADSAATHKERIVHLRNAIKFGEISHQLAVEIGSKSAENEAATYLQSAYRMLGDLSKALYYADIVIATQSDIFSSARAEALAQLTTRYETEKKQLQIERMGKEKELDEQIINRQRTVIYAGVYGLLLAGLFLVVLFRLYRQKHRANVMLALKNEEINQQKEEILAQRDEIETQRDREQHQKRQIEELYRIALERKNSLELQQEQIQDSIEYSRFIQRALLPDLSDLSKKTGCIDSHFLLYRPKDMVSGDFYWYTIVGSWLVITVADCTGHGVPGALMSMMGITFLNQTVRRHEEVNPAQILNELRAGVIDAFRQTGQRGSQSDGLEMSLAAIHIESKQCLWAGANSPLWIIRQNPTNHSNSDGLEILKPDPMPVSSHLRMASFTLKQTQLYAGDSIYMFTDGFGDQFGGEGRKKFNMNNGFQKLVVQISSLPLAQQSLALEKAFDEWVHSKGLAVEQTDDVTVLGLRIA